ncbi:MAG: dihydrodipicolinate synthase family protein [Clostridia bacterium]|nr:dihydrodipicolinate synthase family protein [Clostridia bacterium]
MISHFQGVFPALITPLTKEEKLNISALETLLQFEMKKGADGFYIGGATGEGLLLDIPERKKLCEKSIEFIGKEKTKIVHITDINFRNTIALAKHAEACGADAISSIAPIYFKYDENDIYNYYKEIAQNVNIPLIIYYTAAAGVNMSTDLFCRLFEIDNITGVKWTSSNYYELIKLRERCPDANIFNGPDEMLVCGLSSGADGGIGSTYNVMYPLIRSIYDHFRAGNMTEALEQQKKADKIINVMLHYSVIPVCKMILEEMGIAVGHASFPMTRYSKEERAAIKAELLASGFSFE